MTKVPTKDLGGVIFSPGERSSDRNIENFKGKGLDVIYLGLFMRNKDWAIFTAAAQEIKKSDYNFAFIAFDEISTRELKYLSKIARDYKDLNGLTLIQVSPRLRRAFLFETIKNVRSCLNAINLFTRLMVKKNIKAFVYVILKSLCQIFSRISRKQIYIARFNPLNDKRAYLLRKHAETCFLGDVKVVVIGADAIDRILGFRNQDLLDSQGILAGISRAGYFKSFVRF